MEKRLGRFAGIALTAALVIEGCSPAIVPTHKPTSPELPSTTLVPSQSPDSSSLSPFNIEFTLINCQTNPFDKNTEIEKFSLASGQSVTLFAITKIGQEDSVTFVAQAPGKIAFKGDITKFHPGFIGSDTASLIDENAEFTVAWIKEKNHTVLGATAECYDALIPKQPTT